MNLGPFAKKIHSQFGEDGQTLELVRRLNPPRYFIEIGAGHNGENNTHVLADKGWVGLWIDAKGDELRPFVSSSAVEVQTAFVTVENISKYIPPKTTLGVLSIDVDGNDYWIWQAATACWEPRRRPWICIIECNAQKPLDEPFVMPYDPNYVWDQKTYENGASKYSMIELGKKLGYSFVGMSSDTPKLDSPNMFFVRSDLQLSEVGVVS